MHAQQAEKLAIHHKEWVNLEYNAVPNVKVRQAEAKAAELAAKAQAVAVKARAAAIQAAAELAAAEKARAEAVDILSSKAGILLGNNYPAQDSAVKPEARDMNKWLAMQAAEKAEAEAAKAALEDTKRADENVQEDEDESAPSM